MQTCIGWVELSTRTHQSHTRSILGFALWLRQAMTLRGDLLVCSKGGKANRNRRVKNEPALFHCFVRLLSTITSPGTGERALFQRRGLQCHRQPRYKPSRRRQSALQAPFQLAGSSEGERRQDLAPRALGDRCFDISAGLKLLTLSRSLKREFGKLGAKTKSQGSKHLDLGNQWASAYVWSYQKDSGIEYRVENWRRVLLGVRRSNHLQPVELQWRWRPCERELIRELAVEDSSESRVQLL